MPLVEEGCPVLGHLRVRHGGLIRIDWAYNALRCKPEVSSANELALGILAEHCQGAGGQGPHVRATGFQVEPSLQQDHM